MNAFRQDSLPRQPARHGVRFVGAMLALVLGAGTISAVAGGMGAQSDGQSLGAFMAQQRQIAEQPLAAVTPAAKAGGRSGV